MMARFCNFSSLFKAKIWVKKGQKGSMRSKQVQKNYLSEKNISGLGAL